MPNELVHLNIIVSGRVQGVFFRKNTKILADSLGIKGFVKNMSDGSVYIEAEGDEMTLLNFINWCRIGPPASQVESIEITKAEVKSFSDFSVFG